MHVITFSPNFAPPHFAARGIQKITPHGTMEGHTVYINMLSVYPFRMEIFSFCLYTKRTLLNGLMFFVKYGKGLGIQFRWANFSSYPYACASKPISWRTKFVLVQACDFNTSGNRELLFRSHNAIDLRRGQQMRVRAFLGREGTFINFERFGAGNGLSILDFKLSPRSKCCV